MKILRRMSLPRTADPVTRISLGDPHKTFRQKRSFLGPLLASWMLAFASAPAVTIDSVWSGGSSGNWNVAGNWTPNGVPHNGANHHNVSIHAPSAVAINGNFSIQVFDLRVSTSHRTSA